MAYLQKKNSYYLLLSSFSANIELFSLVDEQDSQLINDNSILDINLPSGMFSNGIVFDFQDSSSCSSTSSGK